MNCFYFYRASKLYDIITHRLPLSQVSHPLKFLKSGKTVTSKSYWIRGPNVGRIEVRRSLTVGSLIFFAFFSVVLNGLFFLDSGRKFIHHHPL